MGATNPDADETLVDHRALRDLWYVVAESADLDPGPHPTVLLGRPYVLWRGPDSAINAVPDRCPHREAPLSIGSVSHGVLQCAYHGWRFGDGGRCIHVPSAGTTTPPPPAAHLSPCHVTERYGLVWMCPGEPNGSVPLISHDEDPSFRRINTGIERWAACATRMTDNFCDVAHFPYVHAGTFGGAQDPYVSRVALGDLGDGWFGYRYEVQAANPEAGQTSSGSKAGSVHRAMTTGFHLPFSVRSTIRYRDGLEHILLLTSTPVDAESAYFTFVVWRNDDFSVDPEETIAFDRAIGAEDKAMLEQLSGSLPLTRTGVVNVQADKASVEWRRRLIELIEQGDH